MEFSEAAPVLHALAMAEASVEALDLLATVEELDITEPALRQSDRRDRGTWARALRAWSEGLRPRLLNAGRQYLALEGDVEGTRPFVPASNHRQSPHATGTPAWRNRPGRRVPGHYSFGRRSRSRERHRPAGFSCPPSTISSRSSCSLRRSRSSRAFPMDSPPDALPKKSLPSRFSTRHAPGLRWNTRQGSAQPQHDGRRRGRAPRTLRTLPRRQRPRHVRDARTRRRGDLPLLTPSPTTGHRRSNRRTLV